MTPNECTSRSLHDFPKKHPYSTVMTAKMKQGRHKNFLVRNSTKESTDLFFYHVPEYRDTLFRQGGKRNNEGIFVQVKVRS